MNHMRFKIGFVASILAILLGIVLLLSSTNSTENLIWGIISPIVGVIGIIICWFGLKQ